MRRGWTGVLGVHRGVSGSKEGEEDVGYWETE